MDQSVHFLTVATADLDAARRFYRDGLGWTPLLDVADEIVFFQVAPGLLLGFFEASRFDRDLDGPGAGDGEPPAPTSVRRRISGMTLAHNVGSREAVEELVLRMEAAGGTVRTRPEDGEFGGVFHAHVEDPNGVVWEIAHNPSWRIDADGSVVLG